MTMNTMTIALGCDHAGFTLKNPILQYLKKKGYIVLDFGTNSADSVDYPDFAHPAALAVESGKAQFGILMCGSGTGVAVTANKHQDIRCALCWKTEIAALARQHNNANMIALPARFISKRLALKMIETFLNTEFEGGRHANRVNKMAC
jgi:ribose 5-phosphate isomerase B